MHLYCDFSVEWIIHFNMGTKQSKFDVKYNLDTVHNAAYVYPDLSRIPVPRIYSYFAGRPEIMLFF